ncbi:Small G protein signaling modulator 2 [Schistosoma japonicum]|nr:Small G protein signaling modulator 2 [Schistosoma japonicum]
MNSTNLNNHGNSQDVKDNLLKNVKIQVKKLMEEAVIRGYVHEDSETIAKLCSSVEAVLLYGIRRSIFTWIEEESTYVLCQKISKHCPEAQQTLNRMDYYKQVILKKRNDPDMKRNTSPRPDTAFQNFWIRVALYEKVLDRIIRYLADNTLNYYEPCSVIADPCDGQLISDLLRGPCTIEYSHSRTTDHLFTDPPVSELIQRRGIYSGLMSRQLVYVPPISQPLSNEQTTEHETNSDLFNSIDSKTDSISQMNSLKLNSSKAEFNEKQNQNGCLNNNNHDKDEKIQSIPIPTITMTPVVEEEEEEEYSDVDKGVNAENHHPSIPIDSIINNNRKLLSNRKVDKPIGNLNTQGNRMIKRGSSPLINVSDISTNRTTTRTGSCAILPQINEFNSMKSNRTLKSNKDIALAAKEHANSSNPIPGYLSLIDSESGKLIVLKWTPNSAVTSPQSTSAPSSNQNSQDLNFPTDPMLDSRLDLDDLADKETFWGYAIKIKMADVVYAHFHESGDQYTLTLIRNDGIQLAPFHFYAQSHVVAFLNCLEQGLKQRGGYLTPSSDMETLPSATSSFSMKSYRPSMPFIFGSRMSLIPTTTTTPVSSSSSVFNKPSKSAPSMPSLTGSGIKQRIYMNIRKAFNPTDDIDNDEESQKMTLSPSTNVPEEKSPIQHVYHIVSTVTPNHTTIHLSSTVNDVCNKLRNKILSHIFHKWYNHFNKLRIVRKKLADLVSPKFLTVDSPTNAEEGQITFSEFCRHVYFGSCDPTIRNEVWPYLLGLYPWNSTIEQVNEVNIQQKEIYTVAFNTWNRLVQHLKHDVRYASFIAHAPPKNDVKECLDESMITPSDELQMNSIQDSNDLRNSNDAVSIQQENNITNNVPLIDIQSDEEPTSEFLNETSNSKMLNHSSNSSLSTSNTVQHECEFSPTILEVFADNLYRIDKDVTRCDRNHAFFMTSKRESQSSLHNITELSSNLIKLRNIISTWVWLHLDIGYIQGMCDLLAPILIVIQDEITSFACFNCLMKWMLPNFPLLKHSSSSLSPSSTKLSPSETPLLLTPPISLTSDMEKTSNNSDNNVTRTTLLQLAVKAARRRTTTTATTAHSKEITVENNHSRPFPGDTTTSNGPRCTNKLKETSLLHKLTDTIDTIEEHTNHSENSSIITSPYDRIVMNSYGLPMSCMDIRFSFLQSLIEIFDPEMNQHLMKKVPEGQLFFSYRWLLLDFKRELQYDDIFPVWETIWASRRLVTYDFGIFFALALLEYYRDIVIYYNMDVTEIIRFYNELTEQHDCVTLLELARSFVFQLQHLMVDR